MADDKKKKEQGGMGPTILIFLLIGVVGWQVASYQLRQGELEDKTEQGVVRHLDQSNAGARPVTWVDLAEKARRGEFGKQAPQQLGGVHQ